MKRYHDTHYNTVQEEFHITNQYFIKRNFSKDHYTNLSNSDPVLPLGRWILDYVDSVKIN